MTGSTWIITTLAGGGSSIGDGGAAAASKLSYPFGVAVDSSGYYDSTFVICTQNHILSTIGNVYIADTKNHRVRKVTIPTNSPR